VEPYKSRVKEYIRRKSKQHLITLKGDHGFQRDQPVYVVPIQQYNELVRINKLRENIIKQLEPKTRNLKSEILGKQKTIKKIRENHKKEISQIIENHETSLKSQSDIYQNQLRTMNSEIDQLNERNDQYKQSHQERIKEIEAHLKDSREEIQHLQTTIQEIGKQKTEYENKYNQKTEDMIKALGIIALQDKALTSYGRLNIWERITGRKPKEAQELPETIDIESGGEKQ
jgi:DNA repair exonuclease SbcCD ATPase subunit